MSVLSPFLSPATSGRSPWTVRLSSWLGWRGAGARWLAPELSQSCGPGQGVPSLRAVAC